MDELMYFDRPWMDKYRHDVQLMVDFQFFSDGYWFETGQYPTEEMFHKFMEDRNGSICS